MRLVHRDGGQVSVGDAVTDFRGEGATVISWGEPAHKSSTGRVYVCTDAGHKREYYPSVFGLQWTDGE